MVSYAVDVSNNQAGHQNWRGFGVHMGIAKATEGRHSVDAWFARHATDIRAAGLVLGAYHFAWPNQSALAEAAHYIATVKPFSAKGMYHLLDLEPYADGRNYAGRTAAQIKAYATAWVAEVQKAFPGQPVRVYTPRDNVAKHYPSNSGGYWYPAYPVQGRSFAAAASLARPVVNGAPVWGWQFTSEPRDMTVIYTDPAALRTGATGKTPTVQEDDMPLNADDKAWIKSTLDQSVKTQLDALLKQRLPSVQDPKRTVFIQDHLRGAERYATAQQTAANVAAVLKVVQGLGTGKLPTLPEIEQAVENAMAKTVDVNVHVTGPDDPAAG